MKVSKDKIYTWDEIIVSLTGKTKILYWDTCSLLDVIRMYNRPFGIDLFRNLLLLRKGIISGNIVSISSILLLTELNDNIDFVISEAEIHEKQISQEVDRLIKMLFEIGFLSRNSFDLRPFNFIGFLREIYTDIFDHTLLFEHNESIRNESTTRLVSKLPPARIKGEYKDCLHWVSACYLSNELVNSDDFVFLSSNTSDFAADEFSKQYILSDCVANGVQLVYSYNHAYHLLKS